VQKNWLLFYVMLQLASHRSLNVSFFVCVPNGVPAEEKLLITKFDLLLFSCFEAGTCLSSNFSLSCPPTRSSELVEMFLILTFMILLIILSVIIAGSVYYIKRPCSSSPQTDELENPGSGYGSRNSLGVFKTETRNTWNDID